MHTTLVTDGQTDRPTDGWTDRHGAKGYTAFLLFSRQPAIITGPSTHSVGGQTSTARSVASVVVVCHRRLLSSVTFHAMQQRIFRLPFDLQHF